MKVHERINISPRFIYGTRPSLSKRRSNIIRHISNSFGLRSFCLLLDISSQSTNTFQFFLLRCRILNGRFIDANNIKKRWKCSTRRRVLFIDLAFVHDQTRILFIFLLICLFLTWENRLEISYASNPTTIHTQWDH